LPDSLGAFAGPHSARAQADNWVHADPAGLIGAGYVWLPFNFHTDGTTVSLDRLTSWDIDNPFQA
jgi:hypothetical protein